MKRIPIALLLTCLTSFTPLGAEPPEKGYVQVFADEFNDSKVDESVWFYRETGLYKKGVNRRENVSIGMEDGVSCMKIRYDFEPVDGTPQFTCGGIITRLPFGYGYYETRSKLFSATTGLHSSFWTMGLCADSNKQIGTNIKGEINAMAEKGLLPIDNQILEIDGYEHDSAQGMDLGTVQYSAAFKLLRGRVKANFGQWNVYGFDFAPNRLRFYVNGQMVHENTLPNPYGAANLWLTALAYSDCKDPSKLPGYSCWDYVRFYTRPYPGANLLANGDFDFVKKGKENPQAPTGWIEDGNREASLIAKTEGRNNTAALKHASDKAFSVTTRQDLYAIPDGNYDLTAWVKASKTGGRSFLVVRKHGGKEARIEIARGEDWREVALRKIPVTGHAATIAVETEAGPDGWLLVDDVVFAFKE